MSIRVVLADDHPVVRDGLRYVLDAQDGISVVGQAADGREVLRLLEKEPTDVVVMDVAMPELNGIEATRRVRKQFPETQVVMLSMHASPEYIYQALHAGAQGYVLKESAGREVVQAVRTAWQGKRYLGEQIGDALIDEYIRYRARAPQEDPIAQLSAREREILQLVVEGHSSASIAERLSLSPKTVETYRSRLMQKLGVSDLPSLVRFAMEHGITPVT